MATGRTHQKHVRAYIDGYDLSGVSRMVGPLGRAFDEHSPSPAFSEAVKGALPGHGVLTINTLSGVLDFSTGSADIHSVMKSPTDREVMLPIGIRAAPAAGDPVYMGNFLQMDYIAETNEGMITLAMPFSPVQTDEIPVYDDPWGTLVLPKTSKSAVNSGTSDHDYGSQTTLGGYMMYQLFSVTGTGTVTLKIQDASTDSDPSFSDLLSSGAIAHTAVPAANIVELATTATVERYLRWQLVFSTITEATFALAFHRGLIAR